MKSKSGFAMAFAGVAIAGLPLLMSWSTIDPVLVPRFIAVAIVTFVLSIAALLAKGKSPVSISFFTSLGALPFYLFFVTALLALPGAINKSEALFTIGKDFMFLMFLLLLIPLLGAGMHRIYYLVKCFIISALIISGFGVVQLFQVYMSSNGMTDLYLVKSTMGHRNLMVSALVLLLPFAAFGLYGFRRFWKMLSGLVLLLSITLIILMESRTGWLAAGVVILFFLLVMLIANTRLRRVKLPLTTLAIGLVVFVLGGFLIFYTATPELQPNAELKRGLGFSRQDDKTFTADERVFMWKATARMINDQPVWGVGPGNWKIWFPKYGSDLWRSRQGMVQFQRPHNDYLWVLSEQGIIGLLAYVFMGIAVFYCGMRLVLTKTVTRELKLLSALILSVLAGYYVVSFFSFPRERIIHQIILYSSFAIILALYYNQAFHIKEVSTKWRWLPAVLFLPVFPLLMVMGYQRLTGEVQTRKMLAARAASQWPVILAEYEPVKDYRFYTIDPTSVPLSFYSGLAHLSMGQQERAESELLLAYRVHPYNIHVVNNLANVYQLSGESQKAIMFYEKALEISPKYLDGALNLIAAYFNSNRVEEAYGLLLRYHELFSKDGKGDARYQQYLLVVLQTMRDNLRDSQSGADIREGLTNLKDNELLEIHSAARQGKDSIYKLMLKRVTETSDF